MPRQPRIEYAGGVYPVLSRGNRQEAIFADDRDRQDGRAGACLRADAQSLSPAAGDAGGESGGGDAIDEHNERQAERLLDLGTARLGLSQERLRMLPKGAAEKRVLAWFVRARTTVSNAWLATHLHAGHPANIPGYARTVQEARDRQIKDLKTRILKSED